MIELNDDAFYLRREREEREMAARARDRAIAAIHLEMAERYAALASRRSRRIGHLRLA